MTTARHNGSSLLACVLLLISVPLFADHPVTLWEIQGDRNHVFVLGSVHLLRATDHPLPRVINAAYEEAEVLIMELDIDDLAAGEMRELVQELGVLREGGSLPDLLGERTYRLAEQRARELDIDLGMFNQARPWYAAMNVELIVMSRSGFDPALGVEQHLAGLARTDGKEIIGLETLREQIEMLSGLSAETERELFLKTLDDAGEMRSMLDDLVRSWRHGDTESMERVLLDDMRDYPELYDTIVVARNRRWVEAIDRLLDDEDDYLVVVGTLHLIGPQGVPSLLRARGRNPSQMREN